MYGVAIGTVWRNIDENILSVIFLNIYYIGIRFFVLDGSETTWVVAGSAVSVILVMAAVAMLALR